MGKVDIGQLTKELRGLERHQMLFKALKSELIKLGYWKNKRRGDPVKGFREMKNKKED